LNYNWFALQAAPPFRLTDAERQSLKNALELLERAKAAENAVIAEKIENLIENLEQGNISVDEAIKELEELQQELEEGDLDTENIGNGIAQMAAILRQSKPLQDSAQQMIRGDLNQAAAQMQALNERLDTVSPADLRDMAEKLLQASERPRTGLQDLAKAFELTGGALQRGDRVGSHSGFDRITRELQSLAQQIADQELRSKAGDEIGDLVEALEDSDSFEVADGSESEKSSSQSKSGQPTVGEPGEPAEAGEAGEQQAGEAGEGAEGEAGQGGEQSGESAEAGENPGGTSEDAANGKGGNSFGGSTKSAPLEGEATLLEVQLEKEALKIEAGEGQQPSEDLEAAGERERSKLDYRNAPSNLTPAQKDLLSQDRIPWQSRQLIKNYFQAVKPTTQTK
jgi:hypothetical protein